MSKNTKNTKRSQKGFQELGVERVYVSSNPFLSIRINLLFY